MKKLIFLLPLVFYLFSCAHNSSDISPNALDKPSTVQTLSEPDLIEHIFQFISTEYTNKHFSKTNDPLVFASGETHLSIQNIISTYERDNLSLAQLDELTKTQVDRVFDQMAQVKASTNISWKQAKNRVFLQIVPLEYTRKYPITSKPIDANSVLTYVIDTGASYRYIFKNEIESWNIEEKDLSEAAIANLNAASHKLPLRVSMSDKVKVVMLQSNDGYAAARIFLPKFRVFLAKQLGSPFYAAFPNREFLIAWSTDSSSEFTKKTRKQISKDFKNQPYPISNNVFLVTEDKLSVSKI